MEDYSNAYIEVLETLNNLIEEDYRKIPKEYIMYMEEKANKDYYFKYDSTKPFNEQNLSTNAKLILFFFFEEFAANAVQKEKIKKYKLKVLRNYEEEKSKKYPTDRIFNNKVDLKTEKNSNDIKIENENLPVIRKDNIFQKIKHFLKRLFIKNKFN